MKDNLRQKNEERHLAQARLPVVIEEAWTRLAHGQFVDNSRLRQEIALSWERCLANKVSPINSKNDTVDNDLLDKTKITRHLLTVAAPSMEQLYQSVRGKGYIVMLSGADGTILHVVGDRKMYSTAETLAVVPGASCSEAVIGTTSPGICLVQKMPVQVFKLEHYCQLYHEWCCSAAPILDDQGNLIGTLDMSNLDPNLHPPYLLDLVKMTAKTIEAELSYRLLRDDFNKSYHYFNLVVNNLPEALIFFDKNDKIAHVNRNAVKILGQPAQHYIGATARSLAPNYDKIKEELSRGQHWTELQFKSQSGLIEVEAYLKAIKSEHLEPFGIICTLKEQHKVKVDKNAAHYTFADYIFRSPRVDSVLQSAKRIAPTDINVLIQGESGTGKEILAQAIHNNSARRDKPFIAINCAALPKELIQSELFGYESGTFTGANKDGKIGKFELANGGTVFLDEIGDMSLEAQANLLRVLQEKCVTRLGGNHPIPLDVRVISATNRNLLEDIEAATFRRDLFYRLAVINLWLPPLRERKEDLWVLFEHFAQKNQPALMEIRDIRLSDPVKAIFEAYAWPGNIREFENTVIHILNRMENSTVTVQDLPEYLAPSRQRDDNARNLKDAEAQLIRDTLVQCGNNIAKAAKCLGISRATLYRRLKDYGQPAPGA